MPNRQDLHILSNNGTQYIDIKASHVYFDDDNESLQDKFTNNELYKNTNNIGLKDVTNVAVTTGDGYISLRWKDPDNLEYDGITLSEWSGTKVVRKEGSAPANENDGTVIVDNKVKDAYSYTAYIDSNLTNGTTYYYRFFPYAVSGAITEGVSVNRTPTSKPKAIMTVPDNIYMYISETDLVPEEEVYIARDRSITVTSNCTGEIYATSSDTNYVTTKVIGNRVVLTGVKYYDEYVYVTISQNADENYSSPDEIVVYVYISDVSPILNDNSWDTIGMVATEGRGDLYWDIGDCKEITLNGAVGSQLTLQNEKLCVFILDFDVVMGGEDNVIAFGGFKTDLVNGLDVALVDDKYGQVVKDGTICFNMNHTTDKNTSTLNSGYNYGGWRGSDLRYDILGTAKNPPSQYNIVKTTENTGDDSIPYGSQTPLANTLLAAFPEDLRRVMTYWKRLADIVGNASDKQDNVNTTYDLLTLLTEAEIFASRQCANQYEYNAAVRRMAYYTNGNSTIKVAHNNTALPVTWWEASAYYRSAYQFCAVGGTSNPGEAIMESANISRGIAPAFLVAKYF